MAETTLNMKLLLRRAEFVDSCVLAEGEPGYHTTTKELKIGDGTTTWVNLPIANKTQIDALISSAITSHAAGYYTKEEVDDLLEAAAGSVDTKLAGYKTLQAVVSAAQTEANVFVDTVAQDANGVITITTKAVDFSAADDRFKKLQTAIEAVATEKNVFIEKIAQDEQGVITISTKSVDFSDYRTSADQDLIDANFKTKQNAVEKTGDVLKTVTSIKQNENGEITDVIFEDIKTGSVSENESGLTTGGSVYSAIELAKSNLKGVKAEGDTTDETIAGAKAYADARKAEVVEMIGEVASAGLTRSIVTQLPDVSDAAMNTIYMIKREAGLDGKDIYDEYILIEVDSAKQFELLGNTELDLSGYATEDFVNQSIQGLDVSDITGFGAGKTLATLTETDGKIAATFQDIAITESQITDLGDYKTKQTAYSAAGDAKKTITNVSQNENGEVTVTYGDIDFSHNHDDQYKKLQDAIEAVETEANVFVDTVAQNANGEIEITTKAVDFTEVNDAIDAKLDANGWKSVENINGWIYKISDSPTFAQISPDDISLTGDDFTAAGISPGRLGLYDGNGINISYTCNGTIEYSLEDLGDENPDSDYIFDATINLPKKSGTLALTSEVDTALQEAKDYADDHDANTTYTVAATANPLEFTVTPSEGEAQTITLVAPTVDTGVMKVTAGTDIVVTPEDGTGEVTVSHKEYQTGVVKDAAHDSATDPSFITSISIENGHVTGATVQNLASVLAGMSFIFDGGTSKE